MEYIGVFATSPQVFLYKCSKQLVALAVFHNRGSHLRFFSILNCDREAGTAFPEAGIKLKHLIYRELSG